MEDNEIKVDLEKYRVKKKKKFTVPKELLEGANSYDEKLEVVKILVDREKSKALLLIKSLLTDVPKK